ncbi:coiled coil domain containing protein 86 [Echinococcus multilocularis]|uniref:Coiled-coil domain-containing protein 86 n=1 Tax=Echinococcus multilocularis TaxID=6211 RepID=A0A068Y6R1_ECHMU|nr:coiled coil domain containing protein 86 [Echinococcus multilocularis]
MVVRAHVGRGSPRFRVISLIMNEFPMTKTAEIRGKPKSGRVWKTVRKQRYSSIRKDTGLRTTWEKKMLLKEERKQRCLDEANRREARACAKKARRLATEERKRRRLENERRAETVVPIKNMMKLKKLKRSQLRTIEKR